MRTAHRVIRLESVADRRHRSRNRADLKAMSDAELEALSLNIDPELAAQIDAMTDDELEAVADGRWPL